MGHFRRHGVAGGHEAAHALHEAVDDASAAACGSSPTSPRPPIVNPPVVEPPTQPPTPPVTPPPRLGITRILSFGDSLTEGVEMVVARGVAAKLSTADLRQERRNSPPARGPAHILHDDGEDWLLFAAERLESPETMEDAIS